MGEFSREEREFIQNLRKELTALGITNKNEQARIIQEELGKHRQPRTGGQETGIGRVKNAFNSMLGRIQGFFFKIFGKIVMRKQEKMMKKNMQQMMGQGGSLGDMMGGSPFPPNMGEEDLREMERMMNQMMGQGGMPFPSDLSEEDLRDAEEMMNQMMGSLFGAPPPPKTRRKPQSKPQHQKSPEEKRERKKMVIDIDFEEEDE